MNITVGNYETKNFDIYEPAAKAFGEWESDDKGESIIMEHAAMHVDVALGILKKALAAGSLNTHELDIFLENIDSAEEKLDEVDELTEHYYLRDNLESLAVEMYDLTGVDEDDSAEDFADEESWIFGPEETETDSGF